jgi:transcription elongation factor Elf1
MSVKLAQPNCPICGSQTIVRPGLVSDMPFMDCQQCGALTSIRGAETLIEFLTVLRTGRNLKWEAAE